MSRAITITHQLIEEGISARAHFQVWWALCNLALPKYESTMNNLGYVDFFHASDSGHYKLFFLALSKIFDRGDSRVAGISELKKALEAEGKVNIALRISEELEPIEPLVKRVLAIRNRTIVHNEHSMPRRKVYKVNGITPNQIRLVIDTVCATINRAARDQGITNTIFESDRMERATLGMLEKLDRWNA
ncbi:MAG: hypothetical protein Q7U94_06320 [Sideroxyarcus sp.]|nr:hypothetical protein [Sideroxyarcus sp.]